MSAPLGVSNLRSGANPKHRTDMNEADIDVPCALNEINTSAANELRFWSKVNKGGPNECWLWTGAKTGAGYGNLDLNGRNLLAHRVAWMIHNGGITRGLCACHTCDTPLCVNPAHLFLGTHAENALDKQRKGRCNSPRGGRNGSRLHPEKRPRGGAHGCAKLTADQVVEIRTLYAAGRVCHQQLSAQFGVSRTTIHLIVRRKTWNHIPTNEVFARKEKP